MMQYSGEGSSGIGYGWEDISELINYKIRIYERSTWATYDEMWYDSAGAYIWKDTNVKFFEKVDREWKIVFVSSLINTALVEG